MGRDDKVFKKCGHAKLTSTPIILMVKGTNTDTAGVISEKNYESPTFYDSS